MSSVTESIQHPPSAIELEPGQLAQRISELGDWFHNLDLHGVPTAPHHFLGDFPNIKWRQIANAIPQDLTGATVLDLCTYLTRRIALPVIDLTGIKGLYDFQIDWIPGQGEGSVEPPDPNRPPVDPGAGPSLFTALQEQLGLKLTNKRLPVEILVIDHWEKAAGN